MIETDNASVFARDEQIKNASGKVFSTQISAERIPKHQRQRSDNDDRDNYKEYGDPRDLVLP